MDIQITSFTNPFSFFCILERDADVDLPFDFEYLKVPNAAGTNNKKKLVHGQYIAVLWKNKWVRGIVNMENQMEIWLVDHGTHLRACENTIWTELPSQYRKMPSRVFETSVHGVLPIDKIVNEECKIIDQTCTTWTQGAIAQSKNAFASARRVILQPLAILSNSHNDVVLADIYLDIPQKGVVNLLDQLDVWPNFMEKNKENYINSLSKCYKERRRHRACHDKPNFPGLPVVSPSTGLADYHAICERTPQFTPQLTPQLTAQPAAQYHSDSSTALGPRRQEKYALTPDEVEEYANMYVEVGGREYNLLNILVNKLRDLKMCETYKDHEPMGRGVYHGKY